MSLESFPVNQAEIEKQRASNQKRWEDVASGENKKRPILEKLTGKNKIDSETVMRQEAYGDDALIELSKKEIVSTEDMTLSAESHLSIGKIIVALQSNNIPGIRLLYDDLTEGRDFVKDKIIKIVSECAENRNGTMLLALYNEVKSTAENLSEAKKVEIESMDSILKKFAKITDKNFKDFALRFVNIGEYKNIINSGGLLDKKEVTIPKPVKFTNSGWDDHAGYEYLNTNLSDFIEEKKDNWSLAIEDMTNWNLNGMGMYNDEGVSFIIQLILAKFHNKHDIYSFADDEKNDFLNQLAEILKAHDLTFIGWNIFWSARHGEKTAFDLHEDSKDGKEMAPSDLISLAMKYNDDEKILEKIPDISKFIINEIISKDKFKLLAKFVSKPEEIDYPADLKEIMKIIHLHGSYRIPLTRDDYACCETNLNHQIMLILDPSIVAAHSSWSNESSPMHGGGNWGRINVEKSKNQKDALLGAVSLLSSDISCEEFAELSKNKKELSHPIFRSDGRTYQPDASEIISLMNL